MLDCWMAFDVEYTVRLAEVLRPYRLKWMEECLIPEDMDAYVALRQRLPWQGWQLVNIGTRMCPFNGQFNTKWQTFCNPTFSGAAVSPPVRRLLPRRMPLA